MHKYAIGGALLLAATHGAALSLGGTQGGVIIGRPLDVQIKASANAAEAADGLCLEAEVKYGETRLMPSLVSVAVQKLVDDGSGMVRVRTTQPVNEPIVTLTVKAGCAQKYTRTYTLLADFEPLPVASSREAALARVPEAAPVRPLAAAEDGHVLRGAAPEGGLALDATPSPIRLPAPTKRPADVTHMVSKTRPMAMARAEATRSKPTASKASPSTDKAAPKPTTPAPRQPEAKPVEATPTPRLKLDPVDISNPLEASAEPPAPVQDVSPQAKKLQDMEQELRGMRAQQDRLQASLETMNAQLTRARNDQYSNPVVYGLGGVAAAALAGLGWVLLRQRRDQARKSVFPWWADSSTLASDWSQDAAAPIPATIAVAEPATVEQTPSAEATAPSVAVTPLLDVEPPVRGLEVREPQTSILPTDSQMGAALPFDVLADLMQHVEFFDSLGHWADAVAHIDVFLERYPAASDLPYLLRLRHAVMEDDEPAIQATQDRYLQHFPHPVPTAYDYGVLAPGLPLDASLLTQISKAWPGAEARRLIESALVSRPGDEAGLSDRNLESFNDLFFLHSLLDTLDSLPPPAEHVPEVGWSSITEVDREPTAAAAQATAALPTPTTVDPSQSLIDIDFSGFDSQADAAKADDAAAEAAVEKPPLPPLDFNLMDLDLPSAPPDKPKSA